MRALVRTTTLGVALAFATTGASAQPYPSKPITLVIGYTPGAVSDLAARTLSDRLDLPLGSFTAFVGAPYFLLALRASEGRT